MRRVYMQLTDEIEILFPQRVGQPANETIVDTDELIDRLKSENPESMAVPISRSGYLQSIEDEKILAISMQKDLVILLKAAPGDFLINGANVAEILSKQPIPAEIAQNLENMFLIGTFPNCTQDILFPVRQLEEIAIRALSPGINDPHTAIEAIDYLASALAMLIKRDQPSALRLDIEDKARVIAQSPNFETILKQAYQQIHHYGQTDVTVVTKLFTALEAIKEHTENYPEKCALITSFKKQIYNKSKDSITSESDREIIRNSYRHTV